MWGLLTPIPVWASSNRALPCQGLPDSLLGFLLVTVVTHVFTSLRCTGFMNLLEVGAVSLVGAGTHKCLSKGPYFRLLESCWVFSLCLWDSPWPVLLLLAF